MKFYLKTWFIVVLVFLSTGLFFAILVLSDISTRIDLLAAIPRVPLDKEQEEILPEAFRGDRLLTRGSPDALIKVVEFSDLQCPFCRESYFILSELFESYQDEIFFQYRHFPIDSFHKDARLAAEASMCAADQGAFWDYHDVIFENQSDLSKNALKGFAISLGLDTGVFAECLDSREYAGFVQDDFNDGIGLGVSATPTFFINGRKIEGVLPLDTWVKLVKELR